ncbi:MAG: hypothetical protein MK171_08525 [Pirellulales bacterium]|nr:hypothetical protein [Pirellulales bacterium]
MIRNCDPLRFGTGRMPKTVNVTITYTAQLARAAGVEQESATAMQGSPLTLLLRDRAVACSAEMKELLFDSDDTLRKSIVVVVDGSQITNPDSFSLERDHDLFLMMPISGG